MRKKSSRFFAQHERPAQVFRYNGPKSQFSFLCVLRARVGAAGPSFLFTTAGGETKIFEKNSTQLIIKNGGDSQGFRSNGPKSKFLRAPRTTQDRTHPLQCRLGPTMLPKRAETTGPETPQKKSPAPLNKSETKTPPNKEYSQTKQNASPQRNPSVPENQTAPN